VLPPKEQPDDEEEFGAQYEYRLGGWMR
jgi:hypothetical protein